MIESRKKNQDAARKIISDFVFFNEIPTLESPANEAHVKKFLKYFSKHIMDRIREEDCYFVDMLEDFERME